MNLNRDLLVLKTSQMSHQAVQHEVICIHRLLQKLETYDFFARSNELIDLNVYKIFRSKNVIADFLRSRNPKPFVFLNALN